MIPFLGLGVLDDFCGEETVLLKSGLLRLPGLFTREECAAEKFKDIVRVLNEVFSGQRHQNGQAPLIVAAKTTK